MTGKGNEEKKAKTILTFHETKVSDSLSTKNIHIDLVPALVGDSDFILSGEHGLGLSPPERTVVPTSADGSKKVDLRWGANRVGYLPPSMRLQSTFLQPSGTIIIRLSDRMFRKVAIETATAEPLSYRYLHDVDDPVTANLMRTLAAIASEARENAWQLLVDSIGTGLAVRIMQMLGATPLQGDVPYPEGLSQERLRRVTDYVDANIQRPIRLSELAGVAALSLYHFSRAFRTAMNITPVRYVWQCRVNRAKTQLRNKSTPLSFVSYDCGFSSQSHFTTVFKRETGTTPAEFRRRLLGIMLALIIPIGLQCQISTRMHRPQKQYERLDHRRFVASGLHLLDKLSNWHRRNRS